MLVEFLSPFPAGSGRLFIRDFFILAGLFADPVTLLVHRAVVPASDGISRSLYRRGLWLPSWAYLPEEFPRMPDMPNAHAG